MNDTKGRKGYEVQCLEPACGFQAFVACLRGYGSNPSKNSWLTAARTASELTVSHASHTGHSVQITHERLGVRTIQGVVDGQGNMASARAERVEKMWERIKEADC